MTTHIRQFHYDAAAAHFTAELSDIGGFHQVWVDSVDEGVTVVNPDTGNRVSFVIVSEEKDAEGDYLSWELASVTETRIDGRFTMTVFND